MQGSTRPTAPPGCGRTQRAGAYTVEHRFEQGGEAADVILSQVLERELAQDLDATRRGQLLGLMIFF